LCLHEDHAVGIAHGYAKATGEPMACVLHSNVGLLHGMMGLYNAWCDRAPIFVLGATGPVDASQRRPWIDWIHTSADQGGLVRDFIKWDDQPSSPDALVEAMARANILSRSEPKAPTLIRIGLIALTLSAKFARHTAHLRLVVKPPSTSPSQAASCSSAIRENSFSAHFAIAPATSSCLCRKRLLVTMRLMQSTILI
jgi:thiamine pyrophosphate-dependent acetolactate synthase large subunit-like protein